MVHIYYGDGKGKTSSAMGAMLRAVGHGWKVGVVQVMKGRPSGEITAIKRFLTGYVDVYRYGRKEFVIGKPSERDRELAMKGLSRLGKMVRGRKYNMVVGDEILTAIDFRLLSVSDVVEVVKSKREDLELILTGSICPKSLMRYGDIITEFKMIKHPYYLGEPAREGVEY